MAARMKPPPLEWHAKKTNNSPVWQCKYCERTFYSWGDDHTPIRSHLRRCHRAQYLKVPASQYFIVEDAV